MSSTRGGTSASASATEAVVTSSAANHDGHGATTSTAVAMASTGRGSGTAAAAAAAATTAATNGHGGGNTNRVDYTGNMADWTWWIIACCVALCALLYAFRLTRGYLRKRQAMSNKASGGHQPKEPSTLVRAARTFEAAWSDIAYVRTLPLWIYAHTNNVEIFWTAGLTAATLCLGMYPTIVAGQDWANPMGYMAFYQVPLIIGLAGKNNTISYLTGISYQKFNYLHRAAGRLCLLTASIHTIGWIIKGVGPSAKHHIGSLLVDSGIVGFAGLAMLTITSFRFIRAVLYEAFLLAHFVFIFMFLIGCYYHYTRGNYWIWAGFVLWGFDRGVSFILLIVVNKLWLFPTRRRDECRDCLVELLSEDVMRLTMDRPLLRWGPGQHAFLSMPAIGGGPHEQHPFSFASIPTKDSRRAVFLVRAHNGITRRLLHHLSSDSQQVRAYVDGPYGISQDLTCYDTVLLVSGGTGITYVLSYFLAVLAAAREGKAATRHIHLVWHVRHASHVSWVAPLLNEALSGVPLDMTVQVDLYLTKSSLGEDPSAAPVAEIKANVESPAGTSHSSLETPSSLEDEKKEVRAGQVDGEGLSYTASTYVRWRAGRADLAEIVQEDVNAAKGTMNVSVCGPTQLTIDTRKAVSKVATPGKVFNGQQSIEFHSETFGW